MLKSIYTFLFIAVISASAQASNIRLLDTVSNPDAIELSYELNLAPATTAKVDFLIALDDSGSMLNKANMVSRLSLDLSSRLAARAYLDFQVGVLENNSVTETKAPLVARRTAVVSRATPAFEKQILQNMTSDYHGYALEYPFDAISWALSPTALSTYNAGFIRSDADLALIIVTDSGDYSKTANGDSLFRYLKQLKGARNVYVSAFVDNSIGEEGTELVSQFVSGAGGLYLSMVTDTLEPVFAKLPLSMPPPGTGPGPVTLQLPLSPSDVNTITVTYGSLTIPRGILKTGWVYDSTLNQILIGEGVNWYSQPQGTLLKVRFKHTL